MEIRRLLVDKNCESVNTPALLIQIGAWYFWKPVISGDELEPLKLDLAPYTHNRGRYTKFELVPFEQWHMDII